MLPRDAWVIARILADRPVADIPSLTSKRFAAVAGHLAGLPIDQRASAWSTVIAALDLDRDAVIRAVAAVDPDSEMPEDDPSDTPATLADFAEVDEDARWVWKGWIPAGSMAAISAFEGVGKSRLALDLAARIWLGKPWPDGQPPSFPERTPTLWICSDGNQDELRIESAAFGLPPESIAFNTPRTEIYGGTTIDEDGAVERLERYIGKVRPGLVYIDSLTYATSRDLCQANHVQGIMTPLRDVAQRTGTTIVPLLHVAKDGDALGRRIKGIVRTILRLECPDPEKTERLRLSVFKSFSAKPPALGVTLHGSGNDYDSKPPDAAVPGKAGRPPEAKEKAKAFILAALEGLGSRLGSEVKAEWVDAGGDRKTFGRAKADLVDAGQIVETGGTGHGAQWTLSLPVSEDDIEF